MSDVMKKLVLNIVSLVPPLLLLFVAVDAMPEEVKWWMRWVLGFIAVGSYLAGAVYGAYLTRDGAKSRIEGMRAALDNEKRRSAELAEILDERKRQEREQAQRDEDADRILKLTMAEHEVIDDIIVAESHGKEYQHSYNTAIGNLYSNGVIENLHDGKTYVIAMRLRPFFEKYAEAIHEIANGTNEDRLRIAESIRQGTYHGSIPS